MLSEKILVTRDPEAALKYASRVQALADTSRDALGFLVPNAYEEAAAKGNLILALDTRSDEVAAYLMFGGVFPHLKVFQVFVNPGYRRHGLGELLVKTLVEHGESKGYLSIIAKVASDLEEANNFWHRMNFSVSKVVQGGSSRNRKIFVRVRELEVPSLLSLMESGERLHQTHNLTLVSDVGGLPTYTIDINVLFDMALDRARGRQAGSLFQAAFNHRFKLLVASEFERELLNHEQFGDDPMLRLASNLPKLPEVPSEHLSTGIKELREIVFPQRGDERRGYSNDASDLKHIAQSIHHRVTGFITSEKALLRSAPKIAETFGLQILGLGEFSELLDIDEFSLPSNRSELRVGRVAFEKFSDVKIPLAEAFFQLNGLTRKEYDRVVNSGTERYPRRRLLISSGDGIVGFASWSPPDKLSSVSDVYVFLDEAELGTEAEAIADHLIETSIRDLVQSGPRQIRLTFSAAQSVTFDAAISRGFRKDVRDTRDTGTLILRKAALTGPIVPNARDTALASVRQLTGWNVSIAAQTYVDLENSGVALKLRDGSERRIPVVEFETLFSPCTLLFPDRDGVVVPINRSYADDLLGELGPQGRLDVTRMRPALLRSEKAYFRRPFRVDQFRVGAPIVFYESQSSDGRGVAIGIARVTRSSVVPIEEAQLACELNGVLEGGDLAGRADKFGKIHMFLFDNFMPFYRPVSLDVLRSLGAAQANLVTAFRVSGVVVIRLCEVGYGGRA